MSQPQPSERTRLLEPPRPQYVFDSNILRERKRRVKQFQCCLCAVFLAIFIAALVITVSFSINEPDDNNSTSPTNETMISPLESILVLSKWPLEDTKIKNKTCSDILQWEEAMEAGKKALDEKDKLEKNIPSLLVQSPSYRHQRVLTTSKHARELSRSGYTEDYATRHMFRDKKDNSLVQRICMENSTNNSEYCKSYDRECNIFHKYRSYDGSCNNLKYPGLYGVSYKPFRRALPPDYADGISKPRASKNGTALPTARTVSLEVHRPYYRDDPKFSVMLAVWGQFLDHDITATALSQKSNGSSISCCSDTRIFSPECFPVLLSSDDPFTQYNVSCIEFVRSAPSPTCCLGPREQMNQVTSYIDGSVVYGTEESKTKSLRTMKDGLLKMYVTEDNRTLLPLSDDENNGCNTKEEAQNGRYCFMTGDARANENLHLTSMHLLWARQHNLIADNLSKLNPHWNDEIIFQEARRIIGAQMQHVTYNEFLPILLGENVMKKFDLAPQEFGYFQKYNHSVDPSVANNFATAVFRFAHTIIPGLMKLLANDSSSPEFIQMHKMLFDPFKLYQPGELDRTLRGAINTTTEASDPYFTNELKSHLFEKSAEQVKQPKLCGLDLVSLNIQRGRDHGLPSYTKWRKHCGLFIPKNFYDLKKIMDREPRHNIKAIYRDIDDIDLYTGALSEKPINGSILGPTLTCLILDQFIRIKYGDRFWYENPQEPHAFTKSQLNEIRRTSLAGIICDNSDNVDNIQPMVMRRLKSGNENVPCSEIPRANLTMWKETLNHVDMNNEKLIVVKY